MVYQGLIPFLWGVDSPFPFFSTILLSKSDRRFQPRVSGGSRKIRIPGFRNGTYPWNFPFPYRDRKRGRNEVSEYTIDAKDAKARVGEFRRAGPEVG